MASTALVDAGPLVALFGRNQKSKMHYVRLFEEAAAERWTLSTTWPCIAEASYLLGVPQRYACLRWVAGGGVTVFPFDQEALETMVEWMRSYTEMPRTQMDLADASLVCLAHETGVTRIMTTDVRDFSRYRLPDGRGFEIL
jgi:predicted nucleic acid-binding protein